MRFIISSAIVLALAAAVAPPASANEKDTQASCAAAGSQITQTLSAAQQNSGEARHESRLGFEACNAGFYHQGMVHYAKAMELLGVKG